MRPNHFFIPVLFLIFGLHPTGSGGAQEHGEVTAYSANKEAVKLTFQQPHILNCLKPFSHHLLAEEFTCPIGGEKFESLVLGTHSRFGIYLDWKPISYLNFPPPLPVCPENGFVIARKDYTDSQIAEIKTIIESKDYREIFAERHSSYYLYSIIAEELAEPEIERWWLLLQATWEADTCGAKEKYVFYAGQTIAEGKKVLAELGEGYKNYWVLNIIIPNLYRRTGDFEAAHAWLKKLPEELPSDYELAFRLLQDAIQNKDSKPVPLKEPKKSREGK